MACAPWEVTTRLHTLVKQRDRFLEGRTTPVRATSEPASEIPGQARMTPTGSRTKPGKTRDTSALNRVLTTSASTLR